MTVCVLALSAPTICHCKTSVQNDYMCTFHISTDLNPYLHPPLNSHVRQPPHVCHGWKFPPPSEVTDGFDSHLRRLSLVSAAASDTDALTIFPAAAPAAVLDSSIASPVSAHLFHILVNIVWIIFVVDIWIHTSTLSYEFISFFKNMNSFSSLSYEFICYLIFVQNMNLYLSLSYEFILFRQSPLHWQYQKLNRQFLITA